MVVIISIVVCGHGIAYVLDVLSQDFSDEHLVGLHTRAHSH
jgi:hypothetical protein